MFTENITEFGEQRPLYTNVWIVVKAHGQNANGKVEEFTFTEKDISTPGTTGSISKSPQEVNLDQFTWSVSKLYGTGIVKRALFDPTKKPDAPDAQISNWLVLPVKVDKP